MNFRSATSALEVWTKLEALYEGRGLANQLFLRRRFFTISMVWVMETSMIQILLLNNDKEIIQVWKMRDYEATL